MSLLINTFKSVMMGFCIFTYDNGTIQPKFLYQGFTNDWSAVNNSILAADAFMDQKVNTFFVWYN